MVFFTILSHVYTGTVNQIALSLKITLKFRSWERKKEVKTLQDIKTEIILDYRHLLLSQYIRIE